MESKVGIIWGGGSKRRKGRKGREELEREEEGL